MKLFTFVVVLILIYQNGLCSLEQKQAKINRIINTPTIDGVLEDNEWTGMPVLDNFIQYEPYNGQPSTEKSIAWVGYDDNALYIGAKFYDSTPENITTLVSQRDEFENEINDLISLVISPYDDQNNSISMMVTSSGIQKDRKCTPDGIDASWDAAWESAAKIVNDGWVVEIKIPYSALRFSTANVQNWGFNIWRRLNKTNEWSTWSYASNEKGDFFNYYGMLNGFTNIKPPLRLSFTPYISGYIEKSADKTWGRTYNAGMDLKYGINESFTLDAILVPDFGQVQSDDQELNLSPYEIKYNEKRQFFTEGTELFNKGNIFYSRRIGSKPAGYYGVSESLHENEEISENPVETKLINAVKVSGRTKGGLGIGVFNAMTSKSNAKIRNTSTGDTRKIETQAFTNYNLLVLDKLMAKNSYISLINTNVNRNDFVANVTATEFKIADKENNYAVDGTGAISYRDLDNNSETGFSLDLNAGKLSGQFKYAYSITVNSDKYNPNDMGYLRHNNEMTNNVRFDYNIYKPFGNFLNVRNYLVFNYSRLYNPGEFADFYISYQISTTLKNQTYLEMHALWRPVEEVDHFEAREPGRKVNMSKGFHNCFTYNTDSRKTLSLWAHGSFYLSYDYLTDYHTYSMHIEPTIKLNNRTSISWYAYYGKTNNAIGFASKADNNIFLGERDVNTIENTFAFNYMPVSDLSFSLRTRHYWSEAKYDNYYNLLEDGDLTRADNYTINHDINYNALSIDASLTWNFLPGSELSIVWKNNIYSSDDKINESYFRNLSDIMNAPQANSISLKMLYYLDYLSLR